MKKVAVIYGGDSKEREISIKSSQAVIRSLEHQKIEVIAVDLIWNKSKIIKLLSDVDCVFIAAHGRGGEDGTLQGFLETLKIPYTGSGVLASSVCMDKVKTKKIWQAHGLATLPSAIWRDLNSVKDFIKLFGFPVAVKPVYEGSSLGVKKVSCEKELEKACLEASLYGKVMLEPWVIGEEYTVGFLGDKILPTIQLKSENEFYDFNAKYISGETKYLFDIGLSTEEQNNLNKLVKESINAVDARGWGRVDLVRDKNGNFFLLELNTVPGLTQSSLVPMAAEKIGMDFDSLILNILKESITDIKKQKQELEINKVK